VVSFSCVNDALEQQQLVPFLGQFRFQFPEREASGLPSALLPLFDGTGGDEKQPAELFGGQPHAPAEG
jgi:hypothetical protein